MTKSILSLGGSSDRRKFYLYKLESISIPKRFGRWGLLNLGIFSNALLVKYLLRAWKGDGDWSKIIVHKYVVGDIIRSLYLGCSWTVHKASLIWCSCQRVMHILGQRLVWNFRNGQKIQIGVDRSLGLDDALHVDPRLLHKLHHRGIFSLFQLISCWNLGAPIWKTFEMLGLWGSEADSCESLKNQLQPMGLFFKGEGDVLVWNGKLHGDGL